MNTNQILFRKTDTMNKKSVQDFQYGQECCFLPNICVKCCLSNNSTSGAEVQTFQDNKVNNIPAIALASCEVTSSNDKDYI